MCIHVYVFIHLHSEGGEGLWTERQQGWETECKD